MMIKVLFIAVFGILLSQTMHAQNQSFTIKGKIKGLGSEKMRAIIDDSKDPKGYRMEDIEVKDDSFEFTSKTEGITYLRISPGVDGVMKWVGKGFIPAKSSLLAAFVFPGAEIEVRGEISDYVNAYPGGDPINEGLARLNRIVYPVMNTSANYDVEAYKLEGEEKAEASKKADEYSVKAVELKEKFIFENPEEMASVWMLSDMIMRSQIEMDRAIELFEAMPGKYSKTRYYKSIVTRINGYKNTQPGNLAPAIVSNHTPDESEFNLESLRGKYVLIDFWGTWCGPCMKGMPKMREYYLKYKDKMEIVGLAQDRKKDVWKAALEKNKMEWTNIFIVKNEEDFVLKYNVSGFPTKILIDPEGKIMGRWVGEVDGEEGIYAKLDKLFAK